MVVVWVLGRGILRQVALGSVCSVCSCSNDVSLTISSFSASRRWSQFDELYFKFASETTSVWQQWSYHDQRRPGKFAWKLGSSIFQIYRISDGRLFWRFLYITRCFYSIFQPVSLPASVVVQMFVIHRGCECCMVLGPCLWRVVRVVQCCGSPYALRFVMCIRLGFVLACPETFICSEVRWLHLPRMWERLLQFSSFEFMHSRGLSFMTTLVIYTVRQL